MTERVIHGLEAVEVNEQYGQPSDLRAPVARQTVRLGRRMP
jgi:hypothetical protein